MTFVSLSPPSCSCWSMLNHARQRRCPCHPLQLWPNYSNSCKWTYSNIYNQLVIGVMSFHLRRLRAITVGCSGNRLKVLGPGLPVLLCNEAKYDGFVPGREPHSSRGIIKGLYMDLQRIIYGFRWFYMDLYGIKWFIMDLYGIKLLIIYKTQTTSYKIFVSFDTLQLNDSIAVQRTRD